MGLFDGISKLFGGQKSGAVAKERLQLVLIHTGTTFRRKC